jgi:phospholipid/cholesterol/gamma-HCH transport system substrate-binding protein/paraquat-inducible protein B
MSGRRGYFKIGLFTLFAMMLFVAGVLAFGLSGSLKPRLECVTIFNRSVNGLSVGSAVNFRGFRVGQVSGLSLSSVEDRNGEPAVHVSFFIEPEALTGRDSSKNEARDYIFEQIARGLKVYLSFQGVTGVGFLDLDYNTEPSGESGFDTDRLKEWSARRGETYIPNGPGRIMEISESATHIVKSLSNVDFSGLSRDLGGMVATFQDAVANLQTGRISAEMLRSMEELRAATAEIQSLAAGLNKNFGRGNAPNNMGAELAATVRQLSQTVKRTEQLMAASQNSLPATMENLRIMSENMRDLSELLKRYPSQLFFGQPPREVRPGATGP